MSRRATRGWRRADVVVHGNWDSCRVVMGRIGRATSLAAQERFLGVEVDGGNSWVGLTSRRRRRGKLQAKTPLAQSVRFWCRGWARYASVPQPLLESCHRRRYAAARPLLSIKCCRSAFPYK